MEALLSPAAGAVANWVAVAVVSAASAYLARAGRGLVDTQRAVKVLMRSDLLARWREARDAGWMGDEARRRWADDHALYLRLVGKNSYLDEVRQRILSLPDRPRGREES